MEIGLVQKIDIDQEMQQAYLDYAMSVIVARALPDARDGLKPVHRRILYAMYDMGLRPEVSYKKSARIVGEVLGKYHPHGDMAVYDAMARMAQDFSMRYLLVDGQGNFGSIDGDPPAAMRYTEARLHAAAIHMLGDIQKNTVDFDANFDGTLKEPVVLPAALPNLLVNGATGIAVGMATSIPPHNLGEVIDAITYMLENWEKLDDINLENLMQFVQGPDFPTGGIILQDGGEEGLNSAYASGRGRVTVQARAHLEEMERGRNRIIVTELPYMTNKASLIERIAELVREERLEGIVDLRDESDRRGMRIVIELSKNADPESVLKGLYRHTPMRTTFSLIMLALVDGEPRLLSLKQALRVYVEHRLEIVRRRSEFDLERARQRAHILEGLRVALKNLDEVIDLIRKAPDVETARTRLMKRFKLSEVQAQAILDMPLRRLAALERKKIEEEYKEVQALIKELEGLLRSPKRMRQVVSTELQAAKEAYGDPRRTQILHLKAGESPIALRTTTELTPQKTVWVTLTTDGLLSRSPGAALPDLTGKNAPIKVLQASSRDLLYLVSEQGEAVAVAVHAIPEAAEPSAGSPLSSVSGFRGDTKLADLFATPSKAARSETENGSGGGYVLTLSRQGMVKKSPLSELPGPTAGLFTLARVNEGDRLGWVGLSKGENEILLATANGMTIRFSEEEVRPMGLVAAGVMGIKLQAGDEIAGMELLPQVGDVFMLLSDGSAKRVPVDQFPRQGRYGQGVVGWKLSGKTRVVGFAVGKATEYGVVYLEKQGPRNIRLEEAPLQSRTAGGKVLRGLKASDPVTAFSLVREPAPGPDDEGSAQPPRGGKPKPSTDGQGSSGKSAASGPKAAAKAGAKTSKTGKANKTPPAAPPAAPAAKARKSSKAPAAATAAAESAPAPAAQPEPAAAAPAAKSRKSSKAANEVAPKPAVQLELPAAAPPAKARKSSKDTTAAAPAAVAPPETPAPATKTRKSSKTTASSAAAPASPPAETEPPAPELAKPKSRSKSK